MNVSFDGIGSQVMTFLNDTAAPAAAGTPVSMSGSGKVQAAAVDSVFMGVCAAGDKEYVAVQTAGVVTCAYSGTAPTVGYNKLAAAKDGSVAAKSTGREYLILAVDDTAGTVTFVL